MLPCCSASTGRCAAWASPPPWVSSLPNSPRCWFFQPCSTQRPGADCERTCPNPQILRRRPPEFDGKRVSRRGRFPVREVASAFGGVLVRRAHLPPWASVGILWHHGDSDPDLGPVSARR